MEIKQIHPNPGLIEGDQPQWGIHLDYNGRARLVADKLHIDVRVYDAPEDHPLAGKYGDNLAAIHVTVSILVHGGSRVVLFDDPEAGYVGEVHSDGSWVLAEAMHRAINEAIADARRTLAHLAAAHADMPKD